eukprot:Seg48.8 transcript_id=Seg48.8/GoldUCD/mRNA.D3Y31 product="putative aminopeptidase W07G4.4" protein_id=Seg48.8/GoldUCD/D3Y31
MGLLDFEVIPVEHEKSKDGGWDSVIVVCENLEWPSFTDPAFVHIKQTIEDAIEVDQAVSSEASALYVKDSPFKILVYSAAGPLNREYEDIRKYRDATVAGVKRALKAGCRKPLLMMPGKFTHKNYATVIILAALEACYVPFEIREDVPQRATKVDALGIYVGSSSPGSPYYVQPSFIDQAVALETGRIVARDIGGSDPERMAARKVVEYVQKAFKGSSVKVSVEDNVEELNKKYPLLGAVNRAASRIERHQGRVIKLEYEGKGDIKSTYMFVGKGITYDTGGADVKAGGHMAGMHRDKCGAATVAGFFKTVDVLKPEGVKFVGRMAMVRNSIGADSYVADEIITSAAGVRIRVGNTDAEGRMVMADVLHHTSKQALSEINPHLMTIATLTGHAVRAVGEAYTIVLDNGPAREKKFAQQLQENGDGLADPFEISTIRREDYRMVAGPSEYEDVLQCNNEPSSMTARGHQFPAAFLIRASGLDKHGLGCEKPLCYSHLDIAGSSGPFPGIPTGSPIAALAKTTGICDGI